MVTGRSWASTVTVLVRPAGLVVLNGVLIV